jgi:FKBP-type peptidyl-prolyl cis-trans isomerase SlyD
MTKTVTKGKVIAIEYTLTLKHHEVVDTNVGKIPLIYRQGAHHILPGVESAVEGMTVGQTKQVVVAPKDGYGQRDPDVFYELPKDKLPQDIQVGTQLLGRGTAGYHVGPTVARIKDETVLLDFNHPLAGRTLFFDLKVVDIHDIP